MSGQSANSAATGPTDPDPVVEAIRARLQDVEDPELPVSIMDLGMVRGVRLRGDSDEVIATITVVPTFLGCPAQIFIEADILEAARVEGVHKVEVIWLHGDGWSLADVTAQGRHALEELGIAVPDQTGAASCPHCGHADVVIESDWGSTLCRRLAYCPRCQTPFELMKSAADPRAAMAVPQAVQLRSSRTPVSEQPSLAPAQTGSGCATGESSWRHDPRTG